MKFHTHGRVAAALLAHSPGGSLSSKEKDKMASPQSAVEERRFIADFCQQAPLAPEQVQQDPRNKTLGHSSKCLTIKDFELVRTLGTGTFARVWLVKLADDPEPDEERKKVYALKVLRKVDVIKLKQVDHVNHERSVLADVAGHPFITTLITSFSDHDSLYMLLDYCPGGEVFSYLRRMKKFSENTARFYAAEIVLILEFLHEREGVAYRDLKPENLLLDAEGHIKLVDFGFAKRLGNSKHAFKAPSLRRSSTPPWRWRSGTPPIVVQTAMGNGKGTLSDCHQGETYTLCGTPEYLAPEVIQSKGHTTAVDWWALGILIYEFVTGYPPFWNQNPMEIYKQIVNKPVSFPANLSPPLAEPTKDIIRQFCTVDRSHRLGNISGGAQRVKDHPFFEGVVWDDVYYRRYKGPIIPPVKGPSDTSCFDKYPDEGKCRVHYSDELSKKWEGHFKDF